MEFLNGEKEVKVVKKKERPDIIVLKGNGSPSVSVENE